jgi:hypothetical protein
MKLQIGIKIPIITNLRNHDRSVGKGIQFSARTLEFLLSPLSCGMLVLPSIEYHGQPQHELAHFNLLTRLEITGVLHLS